MRRWGFDSPPLHFRKCRYQRHLAFLRPSLGILMDRHLEIFRRIKRTHAKEWKARGLVCKVGSYMDSFVIKLQKPHWTNDSMKQVPNTMGIYFSIWVCQNPRRQDRL